jgi:hypothetical protein
VLVHCSLREREDFRRPIVLCIVAQLRREEERIVSLFSRQIGEFHCQIPKLGAKVTVI